MGFNNLNLKAKILTLVIGGFVAIGGIVFFVTIDRVTSLSSYLTDDAAMLTSETILNGVSAYGEIGDMDGLEIFLKHLGARDDLKNVHVFRSAVTESDFGKRSGASANDNNERRVLSTGETVSLVDQNAHVIRFILPSMAEASCLECHTSAKTGDVLGAVSIEVGTDVADAAKNDLGLLLIGVFAIGLLLGVITLYFSIDRIIVSPISDIAQRLHVGADQLFSAAAQLAEASTSMSMGANEQASSLEQVTSSLEEMSAMTAGNRDNARRANGEVVKARQSADTGYQSMDRLQKAISRIKNSADETSKIVKTIEEIAFQTNLLALNAAVEAARAGEAGKGFAVVAEEVRSLAARSADAAKETARLIDESQTNAEEGVSVTAEAAAKLQEINTSIDTVVQLISEVTSGSEEQSKGIEQINQAVWQIDSITQASAASSEENAAASKQVNTQSADLRRIVAKLIEIVGATGYSAESGKHQYKQKTNKPSSSRRMQKKSLPSSSTTIKPDRIIPLDDSDLENF